MNNAIHEAKLAEWRERIRECQNSGEKIIQWCRENGVNRKRYYKWRKKIRELDNKAIQTAKAPEIQFAEIPQVIIEAEEKKAGIIIQNSSWRIELQNHANPELVRQIMQTAAQYV